MLRFHPVASSASTKLGKSSNRYVKHVCFQVRAVALRDQGTLNQRGSTELGPPFGDPPAAFGFIRVRHARNDSKVGQFTLVGKVANVPDDRPQDTASPFLLRELFV